MTGQRFRRLRERLPMTRVALARELGCHWNTINKWEHGWQPIPAMASRLFLSLYKELRERLKKDVEGA